MAKKQAASKSAKSPPSIRDRIVDFRRVKSSLLRPNPKNWRTHPEAQRGALLGLLGEVGYVDALLARQLEDGSLELIDGHLRAEISADAEVPVIVTDLSSEEAALVLAAFDPIAAMAKSDADQLASLLEDVRTSDEALQALIDEVAIQAGAVGDPDVDETEDADLELTYHVVVECQSEREQRQLFEFLRDRGHKCRALKL